MMLCTHCALMTWGAGIGLCIGSIMPHAPLYRDVCTGGAEYSPPRQQSPPNYICVGSHYLQLLLRDEYAGRIGEF
eukprot:5685918-Pyramimonas_sp.AAC.1